MLSCDINLAPGIEGHGEYQWFRLKHEWTEQIKIYIEKFWQGKHSELGEFALKMCTHFTHLS